MKSLQVVVLLRSGTGAIPCRRRILPTVWWDNWMSQVGQCSYNPVITPAGVLASPAHHQILDLGISARPAGRSALFAAIEFLSHQLAIPGENGIGFGEARDWQQAFAT